MGYGLYTIIFMVKLNICRGLKLGRCFYLMVQKY